MNAKCDYKIIIKNADGPGIHEDYIAHQWQEYVNFTKTQVDAGKKRPLGVGVPVFDETNVSKGNHNKVLSINKLTNILAWWAVGSCISGPFSFVLSYNYIRLSLKKSFIQ